MKETVVLEGKSGAGKSTAVVALVEWLKQNLGGSVETQQPQKPKDQHPAYQGLFGKAFAVPRIMAGYIYDCTMWLLSKLGFSTKILPVLDVSRTTTTAQHTPEAQPNSVTSLVLAHVYFRLEDMKDQTVEMTLGSLLVQFVEQLPDAISPVQELYRQHNGSTFSAETSPSAEDFRKTILLVLGDHRACVFLDGLDECGKAFLRELLPHIHYLQKQSGMGLVLTDRINQSKQTWFKFFPSATRIPLHADDGDVRAYVNMRLHTFAEQTTRSDHWICNETLRKAVTDTVAKASGGMFLLVRLHVEYVLGARGKSGLDRDLQTIRGTKFDQASSKDQYQQEVLTEAFMRNLERVLEQGLPWQQVNDPKLILGYMRDACRPLTMTELCNSICMEVGEDLPSPCGIPTAGEIGILCQGLVDWHSLGAVRFVHQTFRQFLTTKKGLEMIPHQNERIYGSCITSLSNSDIVGVCPDQDSLTDRLRDHPFLSYSARYWHEHLANFSGSIEPTTPENLNTLARVSSAALRFLGCKQRVEAAVQITMFPDPVV